MASYKTAQVAAIIGIHPNTVRLYEEWGLIPKPERLANGYRVFTDFHLEQLRLARLAFRIEVLQNGLRKRMVELVKRSAARDFDAALALTADYLLAVRQEMRNAEEAATLAQHMLTGDAAEHTRPLRRSEAAQLLGITTDTLRNWEMNGLLAVRRRQNGYRVYCDDDLRRLKIIRSLRCANYSLEAILGMLTHLSDNPELDIPQALGTPRADADIVAVCDRLIASLTEAEQSALQITALLQTMKIKFQ